MALPMRVMLMDMDMGMGMGMGMGMRMVVVRAGRRFRVAAADGRVLVPGLR